MPLLFDEGPSLALEDFRLIRDLINQFCGIHFSDDARTIVARRLRERLDAVGLGDYRAYYQHLRYHPDALVELENAVEVLTTNETYFFREEYQLRAFRDEILPQLKERAEKRGVRRLALWSAGC